MAQEVFSARDAVRRVPPLFTTPLAIPLFQHTGQRCRGCSEVAPVGFLPSPSNLSPRGYCLGCERLFRVRCLLSRLNREEKAFEHADRMLACVEIYHEESVTGTPTPINDDLVKWDQDPQSETWMQLRDPIFSRCLPGDFPPRMPMRPLSPLDAPEHGLLQNVLRAPLPPPALLPPRNGDAPEPPPPKPPAASMTAGDAADAKPRPRPAPPPPKAPAGDAADAKPRPRPAPPPPKAPITNGQTWSEVWPQMQGAQAQPSTSVSTEAVWL